MNAWEVHLSSLCKFYQPDSLLVRSGLWSARWMHGAAIAGALVQLWYIDRGGQFERLVQSTIPLSYPRASLTELFKAKMHTAEAMVESEFTA